MKIDVKVHERVLNKFWRAVSEGKMEDLIDVLKEAIVLFADGVGRPDAFEGERHTGARKPIYGREKVSWLLVTNLRKFDLNVPDLHREIIIANG